MTQAIQLKDSLRIQLGDTKCSDGNSICGSSELPTAAGVRPRWVRVNETICEIGGGGLDNLLLA